MNKKRIGIISMSLLFALSLVSPVNAATTGSTDASVTLQPGALSITSPDATVNFGNVSLDGTVKNIKGQLSTMNFSDYRGTGDGYHITLDATQFSAPGGATLPTNSLTFAAAGTLTQTDGTSTMPTVSLGSPATIDGGAGVTLISAATAAGQGAFSHAFNADALSLQIDTASGTLIENGTDTTYTSTLTWTIVTAP